MSQVSSSGTVGLYAVLVTEAERLGAGVTWDSIPLKLSGGTNKSIPGPKIPVERIRGD